MLEQGVSTEDLSLASFSFQQSLRIIVATSLAARNDRTPCETIVDGRRLVGTSSVFRKTGQFSHFERITVGEKLFPGVKISEENPLSDLLGNRSAEQLRPVLTQLQGVEQQDIRNTLCGLAARQGFTVKVTTNPDVVMLVFPSGNPSENAREVFFYIGQVEERILKPENRILAQFLVQNHVPKEVSEAIYEQALAHPRFQAFEHGLLEEFEYDKALTSRLGRNPFGVVHNIFMQEEVDEFITPIEYAIEFNMILDGVLLPSQARLVSYLDAFYPFFDEYTEGLKGYILARAESGSSDSSSSAPASKRGRKAKSSSTQKTGSHEALERKTGLSSDNEYTQQILESFRDKTDSSALCMPEEREAMQRDRLALIESFRRAYEESPAYDVRLARYSANNLFRDLRMLTRLTFEKIAEVPGVGVKQLKDFEDGKPRLSKDEVESVFQVFGQPTEGQVEDFFRTIVASYVPKSG